MQWCDGGRTVAEAGVARDNAGMTAPDRLARLMSMLENDPEDAFCLYGVAQEHAGRGDHATALDWYEKAAIADPDDGYIQFHRARSLEQLGRVDDAIAAVHAGIEAARRGGDAHAISELEGLLESLGG